MKTHYMLTTHTTRRSFTRGVIWLQSKLKWVIKSCVSRSYQKVHGYCRQVRWLFLQSVPTSDVDLC